MQIKSSLVALSVLATLVLATGDTAQAQSESTNKNDSKTTTKVEQKAPEPVIETVKEGDTLTAIAEKHQTSYIRLFDANESISHPDLINVDQQVRIPRADETLPDRMSQVTAEVQAAVIAGAAATNVQPAAAAGNVARGSSAGNTYSYGWCTWYAKSMRPDLPNNLGDAGGWVAKARAQGMTTSNVPRVGAIAEQAGHVAYVQAVNGNMVTVSEMGWNYTQGVYNTRTVPASTFSGYIY